MASANKVRIRLHPLAGSIVAPPASGGCSFANRHWEHSNRCYCSNSFFPAVEKLFLPSLISYTFIMLGHFNLHRIPQWYLAGAFVGLIAVCESELLWLPLSLSWCKTKTNPTIGWAMVFFFRILTKLSQFANLFRCKIGILYPNKSHCTLRQ